MGNYFTVAYDLHEHDDYAPLIDELNRLNAAKAQESYWLIELNNTTAEVKDHFKNFLPDPGTDKLMIVKFTEKPRFTVAFTTAVDWINARFP